MSELSDIDFKTAIMKLFNEQSYEILETHKKDKKSQQMKKRYKEDSDGSF